MSQGVIISAPRAGAATAEEIDSNPGRGVNGAWIRMHKFVLSVLIVTFLLPMMLSPDHPVAVYGFLIQRYTRVLSESVCASSRDGLGTFLVSTAQMDRYRREACQDMVDTSGGRLFAIVHTAGGSYRQESLRTWNSFLPDALATSLGTWIDYKELPYLGDEVGLWKRGDAIVAMGHYHPFGGGPSPGDGFARRFSTTSEVVVSNGLIPFVYLDGALVPYGPEATMSKEVFRSIRTMEKSVTMTADYVPPSINDPSAALKSFVAFLSDGRQVNVRDRASVAQEVQRLCLEFRADYEAAFARGYVASQYTDDLDRMNMLWNLSNLEIWSFRFGPRNFSKPAEARMNFAARGVTSVESGS